MNENMNMKFPDRQVAELARARTNNFELEYDKTQSSKPYVSRPGNFKQHK